MGLSSNILWHQTTEEGFKAILDTGELKCSYCLEHFLQEKKVKVAFPMISLSDIPLADISEYLDQYDGYLFGFSREWVIKNNFNPVWYCEKNIPAITRHKELAMDKFFDNPSKDIDVINLLFLYGAYMKNVEEELKLKSRNEYYKNYRFYDEREYRYVPDYEELKTRGIAPYLSEEQYEKYKLSHNGKSLIDFSVKFTENDLKMIIVHNNDEAKSLKCSQGLTDVHIFTHEEVKQSIVGVGHKVEREISGNNYTLLM